MGISHNRISLSNVYLNGASIQLGECVSEPSGYSQHFLFEPIDRLLTSPWGKPDYAIDADCYATAVLALHLLLGYQPFADVSREDFIHNILLKGSYHTLVVQWDISENLQDLFRALLNDAKRDRCAPEHMESWIAGRRFNLILPSVAQETARGFDFAGQSYYNRKMLAQAIFTHWEEGKTLLFDTRLPRWIETGIHKKEIAETITRIASNNMGDTAKGERQNNDLLSRIIMALDPTGPIRIKTLSFMPEGIGTMLAHLYFSGSPEELQLFLQAIDSDLASQWIEPQKTGIDYSTYISRMQKMRNFLRMAAPGFGIERCLYDFHPALACQSPLVKKLGVRDLPEILFALDQISITLKAGETDFMDKHIAAFIASKLEMSKELHVHEIDVIRDLASDPRLVALKILARAQQKIRNPSLKGLTHWIALRLFGMADYIHKRDIRHTLQSELKQAALSGQTSSVAEAVLNPNIFVTDFSAFKKAVAGYATRKRLIAQLKNPKERERHARVAGRGFAQILAYGTSLFTIYFTLHSYYHF